MVLIKFVLFLISCNALYSFNATANPDDPSLSSEAGHSLVSETPLLEEDEESPSETPYLIPSTARHSYCSQGSEEDSPKLSFSFKNIDELINPPAGKHQETHESLLQRVKNGLRELIETNQNLQIQLSGDLKLKMSRQDLDDYINETTQPWQAPPKDKNEKDTLLMVIQGSLTLALEENLSLKRKLDYQLKRNLERQQQSSLPSDDGNSSSDKE